MKKTKFIFPILLCIFLISGCDKLNLKYYLENTNNSNTQQDENKTPNTEDFFNNSSTTFTDNITTTSLQTLYETCKKATVTIETFITKTNDTTALYSSGSGFIAKESENYLYIYTNAHVINIESDDSIKNNQIEVILSDYSRYKATVIASDPSEDVAIVRINKPLNKNYLIAAIADSNELKVGESVFAIGSPLGLNHAGTLTLGIVSGVNVKIETDNDEDNESTTMYLIQTDAAINPGNSGGPLFNLKGEVVGVNTLKILQSYSGVDLEGIGFAIPSTHFELVANTIIDGNTYSRPLVGISVMCVSSLSLSMRDEYNISMQYGLYVDKVTNTNLNLPNKTIITHINNKQVLTFSDFSNELYNYKKGDTITLTYCDLEGSNSQTITITLI